MLVLKLQPYPRARPVLDDDALQINVVDEGAWFLQRVRGYNWKYRTVPGAASYSPGDNPAQIQGGATAIDDDPWSWRAQQWPGVRQPSLDDDDLPAQLSALYDDDHWISGSQRSWPASQAVVADDGDGVASTLTIDDDVPFTYRNRIAAWRLVYPSRRGGSADNSSTAVFDDDPWRAVAQRTWELSRPLTDDEILGQAVSALGLDDEPAFTYRHRVPAWRIIYPSRRGGSADNNDAIVPLGVEDDPWQPQTQRLWGLAKAFSDDEVYVVNCAEDYLWIATQSFWQTPLVARIDDDDVVLAAGEFGIDDDAQWYAVATASWQLPTALIDDEIQWFETPTPPPEPPSVGPAPTTTASSFGGGAGFSPYRHSSLSQARHAPGVRQIIEQDDEMILEVLMKAVIEGKLH